jgi:hypothetical protein
MTPIGRGQRQLIIGDRQTGKTALLVDTIINQKRSGAPKAVKCIYVAIGQKASTVAEVVDTLEEHGAMEYTVVVNAAARTLPALQMYAPYAGSAIGQYWMYNGEHALVMFDDLSKQAVAYREISLLLRRPPGREAYPGDVFYLHSRLLERCAKLSDELGGGLAHRSAGHRDQGQRHLGLHPDQRDLDHRRSGVPRDRPVLSGCPPRHERRQSVSRVGGNAQIKAMKKIAGPLRLNLAQFRELAAFAEFGSELDAASLAQLERGRRVVEVLKQPQFAPVPVEEQVLVIFAVTEGHMDDVPVEGRPPVRAGLREFWPARHTDVLAGIRETGKLPEDDFDGRCDQRLQGDLQATGTGRSSRPAWPSAALRDTRRRIKSVEATKKITRAMELIAASRIPKATGQGEGSKPYTAKLIEVIENVGGAAGGHRMLLERREVSTVGILVVSSDRGLAGAYASNIIRLAERRIAQIATGGNDVLIYAVGKKAQSYFRYRGLPDRAGLPGGHRHSGLRRRPGDCQHHHGGLRLSADRRPRGLLHQVPVGDDPGPRSAEVLPITPPTRRRRGPHRSPTSSSRHPVRSSTGYSPVRGGGRLQHAARGLGVGAFARRRAMKAATDNAEELIKDPHRAGQPGPPGRDHHRHHRDRRRCRSPGRTPKCVFNHSVRVCDVTRHKPSPSTLEEQRHE